MEAIKFNADVIDGMIKIPGKYNKLKLKHLEIIALVESDYNNDTIVHSDDYIKKNWKKLLMECSSDSGYYKSEQYKADRGDYLMEKYR